MPNGLDSDEGALEHLLASPRVRYDAGRSRRESLPLESHGELGAETDRADPLSILSNQDASRLPEVVPLRYGRMSRSPFTFLRGAAAVMASDLATGSSTDIRVEACGDAHLGNFRLYNAPDRRLVFDLNDFDETLPGPFEWDVKRLAASITVAARNNGHSKKQSRFATRYAIRHYREFMGKAAALNPLDLYYYRFESKALLKRVRKYGSKQHRRAAEIVKAATAKNSLRALSKYTKVVDGHRVIVPDPPLIVPVEEELAVGQPGGISALFERYRETLPLDRRLLIDRFTPVDAARKVVGVGSVGTRCLIVLLEAGDKTPLFLQFKQAVPSVLEPHLGASEYEQAGQRVVEGQRLIQATSDVFLGWARHERGGEHVDFYFRQLWDGKGKLDVDSMPPESLASFAGMCGKTLAAAHARSGDAATIHGYIGQGEAFDEVIVEFAHRYAERTKTDHARLQAAIDDRIIEAMCDI